MTNNFQLCISNLNQFQAEFYAFKDENSQLKIENTRLKAENHKLNETLSEEVRKQKCLQTNYSHLFNELEECKILLRAGENKIKNLESAAVKQNAQIEKYAREINSIKIENSKLKSTAETYQSKIDKYHVNNINEHKSKIQKIETENTKRINDLNQLIATLQGKLNEKDLLLHEVNNYKIENKNLKDSVGLSKKEYDKLKLENEQLKVKITNFFREACSQLFDDGVNESQVADPTANKRPRSS